MRDKESIEKFRINERGYNLKKNKQLIISWI